MLDLVELGALLQVAVVIAIADLALDGPSVHLGCADDELPGRREVNALRADSRGERASPLGGEGGGLGLAVFFEAVQGGERGSRNCARRNN